MNRTWTLGGLASLAACLAPGAAPYDRADAIRPALVRSQPPHRAFAVDPSTPMLLVFSEPLDPSTLVPGIRLTGPDGADVGLCLTVPADGPTSGEWSVSAVAGQRGSDGCEARALARTADHALDLSRHLADLAGNEMGADLEIVFSTAP